MRLLHSKNAGFSILEMMLVLAILGILVAISMPIYDNFKVRARRVEALTNLQAIKTLVESYVAEHSSLPTNNPATNLTVIGFKAPANGIYDYALIIDNALPGWHAIADSSTNIASHRSITLSQTAYASRPTYQVDPRSCLKSDRVYITASGFTCLHVDGAKVNRSGCGNTCPSSDEEWEKLIAM
jgi:prepilin-type N-terminal cleavage/methylation domain-containing protein